MSQVLVDSGTAKCLHQGTVKLTAGQSKLTVNGAKALVDGDLAGATVSTCMTVITPPPPGPVSTKCLTVSTAIGGVATKLKVSGKGVLLKDVQGQTDGQVLNVMPQTWSVLDAGQTKLTAV
jgi:hypothetical protein